MSNSQTGLVGTPRMLRFSIAALLPIAVFTLCITWQASQTAVAAVYTYTPAATFDYWAAGTNWSAIPVSDSSTQLTFVGSNDTVLSGQVNDLSIDDIAWPLHSEPIGSSGYRSRKQCGGDHDQ